MRIDRDTPTIVDDRQPVAGLERYLDPVGMAGDGFVHRIVEHFGGQVVIGALVGAADIHPGAAANGFEPLEHLDRRGVVIAGAGGRSGSEEIVVGHCGRL